MNPNIPIETPQSPVQKPIQTSPPIENNGLRLTKYLWILLGILVLITAIGSTAYFLNRNQAKTVVQSTPSPTPDPTANWKTYSDPSINFTFKYPQNFDAKLTKTDSNNRTITISSPSMNPQSGDNFHINLTATKNVNNVSLIDYLREKYGQPTHPGGNPNFTIEGIFKDFKLTNIPLQDSYSYVGDFGGSGGTKISFFSSKDIFYTFTLIGGSGTGAGYSQNAEKTYDQILSTFKINQ